MKWSSQRVKIGLLILLTATFIFGVFTLLGTLKRVRYVEDFQRVRELLSTSNEDGAVSFFSGLDSTSQAFVIRQLAGFKILAAQNLVTRYLNSNEIEIRRASQYYFDRLAITPSPTVKTDDPSSPPNPPPPPSKSP